MRIACFSHQGRIAIGAVDASGTRVAPLPSVEGPHALLEWIDRCAQGAPLQGPSGSWLSLNEVRLLAPIPKPRRNLWCVGRNYHAHAKELRETVFKDSNANPQAWPIVFTKVPQCVIGPGEKVVLPTSVSIQIDYEAELAVIIGKAGKNISRAHAMDHVFGYTIVNDVTARDVQMRHQQWDLGKSFDTFCPMGPWVVTADELEGRRTRVQCWVNGQLRQDASTEDMIFDLPTLIETCSRGITLLPGDIIATGTPAGVGMGLNPPAWLRHGDTVRVSIEGLGTLENTFVEEHP